MTKDKWRKANSKDKGGEGEGNYNFLNIKYIKTLSSNKSISLYKGPIELSPYLRGPIRINMA